MKDLRKIAFSQTHPRRLACLQALAAVLLLACRRDVTSVTAGSARSHQLRESFEAAPTFGSQVYVLEAGDSEDPPLVLIHGLGDNAARDFDKILPALSAHHHVLTFDMPGFGRSAERAVVADPARYAAFVQGMITRHFQGPVNVLGHSMGGGIAILLASQHPELVERLALLDVAGILHWGEYTRAVVGAKLGGRGHIFDPLRRASRALFNVSSRLVTGGDLVGPGSKPSTATLFVEYDFGAALRGARAPTWIGWGQLDEVAPLRTMDALSYLLPTRDTVLYADSEHSPMLTEPNGVARDLVTFFGSVSEADAVQSPSLSAESAAALPSAHCNREHDRVFEGDYDRIEIEHCQNVTLRNVRARFLSFKHASATLTHVEVQSASVGALATHSRLNWVGGSIHGEVCFELASSRLNLVAVDCTATGQPMRVQANSKLLASVSQLEQAGKRFSLHGEFSLPRNVRR